MNARIESVPATRTEPAMLLGASPALDSLAQPA
jgi:hypothetical protein